MPDVSVIVPVYNIKTLLPRCVASLQARPGRTSRSGLWTTAAPMAPENSATNMR